MEVSYKLIGDTKRLIEKEFLGFNPQTTKWEHSMASGSKFKTN